MDAALPVVRSLEEGGDELLTFFQFPKRQWKTLRTTNVIERLNEEFRPAVDLAKPWRPPTVSGEVDC